MTKGTVTVERVFEADITLVWKALTEKELMKLWYFDLKEFKPALGFKFEFIGGPEDGVQYKHLCEITEVRIEKKLSYTWKYEGYDGITKVSFELFKENKNTRVKLTHSGIDTFPSSIPDFGIHNFEAGWDDIINR